MGPTIKTAGVLLAAYATLLGPWAVATANADDDGVNIQPEDLEGIDLPDFSGDNNYEEGLENIEPEDLEGVDLPDFSDDGTGNFTTWGSSVNVRSAPSTDAKVVEVLTEPTSIDVFCQVQGETVSAEGYTNNWWAYLPDLDGYITNIYVDTPESYLPGVLPCDETAPDIDPEDVAGLDDYDVPTSDDSPVDPGVIKDLDKDTVDSILGRFTTWGSNVNVRSGPTTASDVVDVLDGPTDIDPSCQVQGELIYAEDYFNAWWVHVPDLGGYISTTYVDSPSSELKGVPNCSDAEQEDNPTPMPDNSTTKEPRCDTFTPSYTPLDDRFLAELTLLGNVPFGPSLLTYIHAVNRTGHTVTLGAGIAESLGIAKSLSSGVYFGPDGSYGLFRSKSDGLTLAASISSGFEMATLLGRPEQMLNGPSYVFEVSGDAGADVGVKLIVAHDWSSINGYAVSVGVGAGWPPVGLGVAKESSESVDLGATRTLCDV